VEERHALAVLFAHLREIKGASNAHGGINQQLNQDAAAAIHADLN